MISPIAGVWTPPAEDTARSGTAGGATLTDHRRTVRHDAGARESERADGSDDGAPDDPVPVGESSRRLDRWGWTLGLAAVLVAAGLSLQTPALLAAAVVPTILFAFGALSGLPAIELEVEREVQWSATAPGEPVDVEVRLTNAGDARLSDVRLVDVVPFDLPVVEGSPRAARALDPGESVELSYAVGARRGVHEFGGVRVRVRNAAGSAMGDGTLRADGDRAVECELPVDEVPLARDTVLHPGAVSAEEHGEGVEFYAVREYRRGDDPSDVDWRRYARSGDLTTVRYREERAATVVLLVDARDEAFVSATPSTPSAAKLSAFAAERAFEALSRSHHDAGLATLRAGSVSLVTPGDDASTVSEARDVLGDVYDRRPLLTVTGSPDRENQASVAVWDLDRRLPARSQVVLFSAATDDYVEHLVRGLIARGRSATVVSPNVATADEPAQHVVAAERASRLVALRAAGARVVEWERAEPLPVVLSRAATWGGVP